ncbi:MAG: penicillin-binding protein 1C [Vibrio sp.]|uniref:penicillin-binding protein 1C n=1 Tax=Vibrio sp. TaxID=678 RepID=UPI003A8498EF
MKLLTKGLILVLSSLMIGLLLLFCYFDKQYPLPEPFPDGVSVNVVAENGEVLRRFSDSKGVFRYYIELDEVSPFYLQSLLNYEDRWFYYHFGVNPLALVRAGFQWLTSSRVISGGSTITMQVARLIDPHQRSIAGKLKQMFRAIQLELNYSKDDILTLYINLAPFGGNISGVESAAQKYFSKRASELNMSEATTLVVLPQKPSSYRPDRHPELALAMRNKVLNRSLEAGLIEQNAYQMLIKEPLGVHFNQTEAQAPLLSRYLREQHASSSAIHTTIDYDLQTKIKTILQRHAAQLPTKSSLAVVILRNKDGAVLGYQGMADFTDATRFNYVDMVRAVRSPGSTIKPFIYGLAIENGYIHSESLLSDIPTSYFGYKPANLSQIYYGGVSVSEALKMSLNVPVVQVLNKITPKLLIDKMSASCDVFEQNDAGLTLALGGMGTNLWSLTSLYRSLAYKGEVVQPYVLKGQGKQEVQKLLSEESSWIIFKTLSSMSAPDRIVPAIRREIAWKTGTSYGYRDFWSVGASKDYTVGVWVGRPDSTPMVSYLGATQASPIMFDVFDQLPEDSSRVEQPQTVKQVEICWPGGQQKQYTTPEQCISSRLAYTVNGITPSTMDSYGMFVINSAMPTQLAVWETEQNKRQTEAGQPIKISNFRSGQHFFIQEIGALPLISNKPKQKVLWYINSRFQQQSEIKLNQYKGKTKITACLGMSCDSVEITIH